MLNQKEILSTIEMIDQQHLDIRTITMGISLLSCCDPDPRRACEKVYEKICRSAEHLVKTGQDIEDEFGIPIVNKRISVTPMALVAGASETEDYVPFALALDRAARTCGVNFIGGWSALVQKGLTRADHRLIRSIPEALAQTELVCSSINVGSTRAGINMDAVALMGRVIRETADRTADRDGLGCAKLVVFCNAVEDNPFMAGAFHGAGEAEAVINVGVSGPGVVYHALQAVKGQPLDVAAETIKKTAFRVTRMGQLVAQEASRRLGVPFGIVDLSSRHRGQRGPDSGGAGAGGLRDPRHHGGPGDAERRGEEGGRHGLLQRGGALRGLHPRQRGRGHDCRRPLRDPLHRQAGGHDLRVLRGPGHDCHSRGYPGGDHRRHHCRRGGDWNGEQQNHRRAHPPRAGEGCGRHHRNGGASWQRPGNAGSPGILRRVHRPGRANSRAIAQPAELNEKGPPVEGTLIKKFF